MKCVVCSLFTLTFLLAQNSVKTHLDDAATARNQQRYADAESEDAAALQEVEKLGAKDARLSNALFDSALTYGTQRKFAMAEKLYQRAAESAEAANLDPRTIAFRWHAVGRNQCFQNKWPEAEATLKRALPLSEKALGPEHLEVSYVLKDLAWAESGLLKDAEAEALYRRALQIQEKLTGRDRLQTAGTLMQLASALTTDGKFEEAEKTFKRALQIRESLLGPDDAAVADTLNSCGDFLRQYRRNNSEAESMLRRALAIREKVFGPKHRQVSATANDLALVLRNQRKFDESENLFLRALDIAEKTDGPEGAWISRVLANLSSVYVLQDRLSEAERLAGRAASLREQRLGPDNPNLVFELENLADVYTAERRFKEATTILERCLRIREKSQAPDNVMIAYQCRRLGSALLDEKRYQEAEANYLRGVQIIEKNYGAKHFETAGALESLAHFYRFSGRLIDAEHTGRGALEIYENLPDLSDDRRARAWNDFAVILQTMGHDKEAAELFEKSLAIRQQESTVDDAAVATTMANLADVYRKQGRLAKAEALVLQAIDSAPSPTKSQAMTRLRRLALIDYDRQQYAHAIPDLEQSLAVAVKSRNDDLRASVLEDLANIKRDTRAFAEAEKLYREALIIREADSQESWALARLIEDMGVQAMRQNHVPDAEPQFLRAKRIYEKSVGIQSTLTAGCLAHLAMLYRDQKRFAEAEPLFQQSIHIHEKTLGADAPALAPVLKEYAKMLRVTKPSEASALEARAKSLAAQNVLTEVQASRP